MGRNWIDRWPGGRIAKGHHGRVVYVIERMVEGKRVALPLDVPAGKAGENAALSALGTFEADPFGFMAAHKRGATKMLLDAQAADDFDTYLATQGRSERYRNNVGHYLSVWADRFSGRDLRSVTTGELKAALREWGNAERHRVIAIKSFCSWLREEVCSMPVGADPTLALKVPPARAEKAIRTKGYPMELVAAIYSEVDAQDVRDVICLRAKTGMHETEAGRVLRGEVVIREIAEGPIAGTIRFDHKSGRVHVQSLDAQALAAAKRLVARGGKGIDNRRQHREIAKAAARLTTRARERTPEAKAVEPIAPGELRHSFVTWARSHGVEVRAAEAGVGLDRIADAIGHQSKRTTMRFYDGTEVPPMIAIPLVLAHPNDPKVTPRARAEKPASDEAARGSPRRASSRASAAVKAAGKGKRGSRARAAPATRR